MHNGHDEESMLVQARYTSVFQRNLSNLWSGPVTDPGETQEQMMKQTSD